MLRLHRAPDLPTPAVFESALTCRRAPAPPPETDTMAVRSHRKPISARAHDCEQIAVAHFRHLPVERKEIAALTHRSDNVDLFRLLLTAT